jgi:NAD(P)-dependent dehydrogenase (short-subunit alcohol dehydrogenase family)
MADDEDSQWLHRAQRIRARATRLVLRAVNAPAASPGRILVTGGSMGIGRACAERLAADGARVVIAARGREAIDETLAALPGEGHEGLVLDVSEPASWERAAPALAELDGLVHAAAVIGPVGPVEAIDPVEFEAVLRINVLGTMLAVRTCLPALRASAGRAVAFSGGGGTGPLPRFDAYAASKAAVVRLVENLARDGVEVNAVSPGFVATRMQDVTLEAGPEAVGEDYYERTRRDLAEGGTPPEKAAELVAFLLSEAAVGISGKLISAPWDPWGEPDFQERLRSEPDFATVRRIDGQFFSSVSN